MSTNISFNSYPLQTSNIITQDPILYDQTPARMLSSTPLIRTEASKLTFAAFQKKTITVNGRLLGTSVADIDSRLDTLKINLAAVEANLDIDNNGATRRYVATLLDSTFTRISPVATAFTLDFLCSLAFGADTSSTTIVSSTAVTTTPKTVTTSSIGGTSPNQWVVMTYTLTTFTGSTINTVTFKNNTTTQQIAVSRAWTAADVVVVDCFNKTVTVNGTAVDYQGVFPYFSPASAGTLIITDDFSARSATIVASNLNRYL